MRLNVCVSAMEKLLCPINSECFNFIGIFLSTIIPLPRVAFGIFIIKDTRHCLHDGGRNVVFRCDQFYAILLAFGFALIGGEDVGI